MRSEESSVWYYSGHAESDIIGKVLRMSELKGASGRSHIHEFNFIIVLYNTLVCTEYSILVQSNECPVSPTYEQ